MMILVILALISNLEVKSSYECHGVMAGNEPYKTALQVQQLGSNYFFVWNDGQQIGIGVRQGGLIAVSFFDKKSAGIGVILYTVTKEGLEGVWTTGGGVVFTETCGPPNAVRG